MKNICTSQYFPHGKIGLFLRYTLMENDLVRVWTFVFSLAGIKYNIIEKYSAFKQGLNEEIIWSWIKKSFKF